MQGWDTSRLAYNNFFLLLIISYCYLVASYSNLSYRPSSASPSILVSSFSSFLTLPLSPPSCRIIYYILPNHAHPFSHSFSPRAPTQRCRGVPLIFLSASVSFTLSVFVGFVCRTIVYHLIPGLVLFFFLLL